MNDNFKSRKKMITCLGIIGAVLFVVGGIMMLVQMATTDVFHTTEAPVVFLIGMFSAIIGFSFLIALPAMIKSEKTRKRYYEMKNEILAKLTDKAIVVNGTYTKKGAKGEAAAKTAASVAAGVLSAAFLGVGGYKVYGAEQNFEYIIDDCGMYVLNPANGEFYFKAKEDFHESEIKIGSDKVVLTDKATSEIFKFKTSGDKVTPEQIADMLNVLTAPAV